ncbi:hypothetical protein AvCA_46610 [Azotobacter vinelandii CA]|uniref:Uncharacterized protein n=2 Tax=Azotobacter vinelandii TaxID=354 RepID=C1DIU7_AZOVD|nr:hypothetical protein Avin_46610 [Azotobacter vinelandii DJ]AGK15889.1 hypothetical protein AvCA_46610 [Azotobacter vinelandii CA]AGK22143.1 hypothetical protein AvCA6_46610 [Azotobacter vinelandii CA6]
MAGGARRHALNKRRAMFRAVALAGQGRA